MDFSYLDPQRLLLLAFAGVCAAVLLALWRRGASRKSSNGAGASRPRALDSVDTVIGWPPESTRVLTLRHQRAYEVLRRALPDHLVLAQVPISHFVKVPTRNSYVEWLRRVGHVCVDLMICDAASNVLAVIEVRQADKVESERAKKRHQRVERVLRAAGIPLHVWNEALLPDPSAVRKAFVPQAEAEVIDDDPDTSPLEPTLYGPGRIRARVAADDLADAAPAYRDPPRTSWFDDLNATRPNALDTPEVSELPASAAPIGAFKPAAPSTARR